MKKSTRLNLLIALAYCVTLIGGMYLGYRFLKDQGFQVKKDVRYANTETTKVDDIIHIIKKKYVDEVNADSLKHLPIDSLLHQLDPHSIYLPPTEAFELSEALEGNFEGVGVEYYILNDTLLVTNVFKDGPAYSSGLRQGDKIIKVDSVVVSGRSLPRSAMMGKIKGKKGTNVQLTILHAGNTNPVVLNVKRGRVEVSSIDAAYMINNETAYIRIGKFGANTDTDFITAIKSLKAKGMKKMVLDLRDNGGGYLTAATGLANQFLPENKLIVYTEGKHEPRTDYYTTGGGEFEQGKLAVLINENSASASEIFAGAIQDLDRGLIIGRRSFGKGLVQEQFAFEDGSALNLTIARYFTPLGRSIQKSYKKGFKAYQHEIEDRLNAGELTSEIPKVDSLLRNMPYITKGGKKVFAGGGIQPDIYVKLDTIGYNRFYATLQEKKVFVDFVFDVLADRYTADYLNKALTVFNISDYDYVDFLKYVESKKIPIDTKQLIASKPLIYKNLKLMLYKYYLGDLGYYKAHNLSDNMVKQAMAYLNP
ncbi:S41 family peptidase [Pedobacter sp. ASV28]|uniref:S41 family peptidase n=1 Tax=Pedobacter sp. ASV28 TaxID=2795123 RepID=UPI0018ED969B|nr:S41 family peptidase [Pedobacter sp. ASV28]